MVSNTSDNVSDVEHVAIGPAVAAWVHQGWTAVINDATWIWKSYLVENPTQEETYYFSKTFDVAGTISAATLKVATDNTYTAKINGVEVGSSADEINFTSATQDTYDVASALTSGSNTVEFRVTNLSHGGDLPTPQENPAGLLYRIEIVRSSCGPTESPVPSPTPTPPGDGGGSGATSGMLIVTNTVINDGPGTKSVGDFQLFLDGGLITSGASYERTGYYHMVTQTPMDGYVTTFGGACAADGSVTLSPGETRTCTVTNDDIGQVLGASTEATPTPTPQGQVLGATTCGIYLDQFAFWTRKYDPAVVKKVQEFLNQYMNANLPVTGFFGTLTQKAVMAFQEKYSEDVLKPWGITMPTGHVYKTTQRMINNLMCASLQLPIPQVP